MLAEPRSAATRAAGRCLPPTTPRSCGCGPSPPAVRVATAAPAPTSTALRRAAAAGPLASLALQHPGVVPASARRHDRCARGWDGRALALAHGPARRGADALIGLAADALGVGRFAAVGAVARPRRRGCSSRDGAAAAAAGPAGVGRRRAGDGRRATDAALSRTPSAAVELAAAAAGFGAAPASSRDVVLAAALCSAGRPRAARARSPTPRWPTRRPTGLVPLRWALACLLADIGSAAHSPPQVVGSPGRSAPTPCAARGGVWTRAADARSVSFGRYCLS